MFKEIQENKFETWGDLFAGGGGTTTGALAVPGVKVLWALNHSPEAIRTHELNHPETKHHYADIYDTDANDLQNVDGLWASIECTQHSRAKGGKEKETGSYTMGWELPRFIEAVKPKKIIVENVREFLYWSPIKKGIPDKTKKGQEFVKWVAAIQKMGYKYFDYRLLNAADFGAFTSRIRLFIVFSNTPINFPSPSHHKKGDNGLIKWNACREKIDLKVEGKSIFNRKTPLSEKTLTRLLHGIEKYCPNAKQFILKYYGNGDNVSSIDEPLHTITTKDRHSLISIKEQFISKYYSGNNHNTSIELPLDTIRTKDCHSLVTVEKEQFVTTFQKTTNPTSLDEPLKTILTNAKHALTTTELKEQFITEYYGRDNAHQSIDNPLRTITTENRHALTTIEQKEQFITQRYSGDNHNRSMDDPLGVITTIDHHNIVTAELKEQFVSDHCWGAANQDIEKPLNTILVKESKQLITCDLSNYLDIKIRMLTAEELADITGFPISYKWYGNRKSKMKMIGNAVPPVLSKVLIEANL